MFNALDLLVIVCMALAAAGLVSVVLMFALRNEKAKKIFFFITAGLGIYLSYVAIRIARTEFLGQLTLGIILALAAVAAMVLYGKGKEIPKLRNMATVMAAVSAIAGFFTAFGM